MAAINKRPVTAGIDASSKHFHYYVSGIFDCDTCGTSQNHSGVLVGYGKENGQDYYIFRNSWGTGWGEDGYVRLANNGDGPGVLGV